ncbi:MAG TPA: hypothetical protein VF699_01285 [Caulobacteraceae bacterium]
MYAGNTNDRLTGNAAANRLIGNGGADQLFGGAGDDRLDGGAGAVAADPPRAICFPPPGSRCLAVRVD